MKIIYTYTDEAPALATHSLLPIVEAFSRVYRGVSLVVLGELDEANSYHRAVREAASEEVLFAGAIYDPPTVQALRFHARAYLHGHKVGGTNPSLVEALWAGNAVIAHANPYNAWTAGPDQLFFGDATELDEAIETVIGDDVWVARARKAARLRAAQDFNWGDILKAYESELRVLGGYTAEVEAAFGRAKGLQAENLGLQVETLGLPAEKMSR